MKESKAKVFGNKSNEIISPTHSNFKTNWLKKLFCKHNYIRSGAVFATTGCVIFTCQKCGKKKQI